jgi:hypothetical protein
MFWKHPILISKTDIAETLVEMSLVKPTTVYSFKK